MVRVVLDTTVIVAAARSRIGASAKLMEILDEQQFAAAVSASLVLEYEEILRRNKLPETWTEQDVTNFLDWICRKAEHYHRVIRLRPLLRDADDDFILETAISAGVDYIVTHNLRDFAGSEAFGVRAISPGEFLRKLVDPS